MKGEFQSSFRCYLYISDNIMTSSNNKEFLERVSVFRMKLRLYKKCIGESMIFSKKLENLTLSLVNKFLFRFNQEIFIQT